MLKNRIIKAGIAAIMSGSLVGGSFIGHDLVIDNGTKEITKEMNFWDSYKLKNPKKENYDFVNWQDENGNVVNTVSYMFQDKKVTAQFTPKIYNIKFLDGETELRTDTYTFGRTKRLQKSSINKDEHPYEYFVCWTDKDGNEVKFLKEDASGDIELYAKYQGKEYKINYELNGGTTNGPKTYIYGVGATLEKASKDGYEFTGWYQDKDLKNKVESISKDTHDDITLYAGFKKIEVKVATSPSPQYNNSRPSYNPPSNVSAPQAPSYQAGRIYCGGYSAKIVYGSAQSIVDAWDSCACFSWGSKTVYADHAFQGFDAIKYNNTMVIDGRAYTCMVRVHGINNGSGIILDNGMAFDEAYPYSIIAYTCNDTSGRNVTVTYWA